MRVLVAHGMMSNKPHYSALLQKNIADRLGLQPGASSGVVVINRGYDVTIMSQARSRSTSAFLWPLRKFAG